jgi:hypothetical protein
MPTGDVEESPYYIDEYDRASDSSQFASVQTVIAA